MPLTKLQFRPGINRETTSYSNEGGWFDGDKVRFRFGFPEKIGGWVKQSNNSFLGSCRALFSWVALAGDSYLGLGTHLKYYISEGGDYNDITPIRLTTPAGDATFSATNGSSIITVTENSHGAVENDFVTFSGATALGGNITATVLNQEYQIVTILSGNSYTIQARAANTSINSITDDGQLNPVVVTANASDTGNGGSSTVAVYQINTGLDTVVPGTGWGAGTWSRGTWGSGSDLTVITDILRLWSHDNFGEDLIINVRDGGIYYWDKSTSSNLFARAVALSDLPGNTDAGTPTLAKQVMVSDSDRHIIAFGTDPVNDIGTLDPLLIRFSDQESPTTWTPTATNTAGDLRISAGSEIVAAVETRQQTLVITDSSVHAMQFLGPPFTFGVSQISENTTIMGPKAAIAVDDSVFWMGAEEFYVYNGAVQRLPCSVRDYVFSDFNDVQAEKTIAAVNSSFGEIWWFYPSANSDNVDRYVIYNYEQQIWYYGTLNRSAWIDRGINQTPIAASTDGYLYLHESTNDDGSTLPASAIEAHIESSQIDIADGDNFAFIRRLIPDVTFRDSTAENPQVDFTIKARNFPGGNYLQSNEAVVTKSASVPVEQFTDQVHIRLRGRSFAVRLESDDTGVAWRLGSPRLDVRQDGRR